MNDEQSRNLDVIRRHVFELWQDGDLSVGPEIFASDFRDHNPTPGQAPGLAGILDTVAMMQGALTDQRYEIVHLLAVDDLVIDFWILRALHTGDFPGAPASGKRVEFCGTDIFRMKNGRITDLWHIEELARLYSQLGLQFA